MNLLTKLGEKFKNVKDETKKRIMATVLAGSIALSGVGMTGCGSNSNNQNNTNPPITNPGGDNGGTQNGGTQTPGNNNGGTQTPGNNNGVSQTPGNNNGGSQTPDYSKYSQILQNVLTDSYYNGLIGTAEAHDEDYIFNTNNGRTYRNQKYQAIPYGFLEDEGFDISKFKNNQLNCYSNLYSINNDLYVELKTEIPASTNYFAHYLLKYSLTEKEIDELGKLFTDLYSATHHTTYYQAPFFVQELSYLKTPEIKSVAYITQTSASNFIQFCNKNNYLSNSHNTIYMGSEYIEKDLAYHTFHIRKDSYSTKYSSSVGIIKVATLGYIKFNNGSHVVSNNNNYPNGGILTPDNKALFEASVQPVITYGCNDHYFKDLNNKNALENVFGK